MRAACKLWGKSSGGQGLLQKKFPCLGRGAHGAEHAGQPRGGLEVLGHVARQRGPVERGRVGLAVGLRIAAGDVRRLERAQESAGRAVLRACACATGPPSSHLLLQHGQLCIADKVVAVVTLLR